MFDSRCSVLFTVRCLMLGDDQCSTTLWIPKEKGMHPGMRLSMRQDMHEGMPQGMRQGMCQGMCQGMDHLDLRSKKSPHHLKGFVRYFIRSTTSGPHH